MKKTLNQAKNNLEAAFFIQVETLALDMAKEDSAAIIASWFENNFP